MMFCTRIKTAFLLTFMMFWVIKSGSSFYILFDISLIIIANCNFQNFLWVEMIRILNYTMWQAVLSIAEARIRIPMKGYNFLASAEQILWTETSYLDVAVTC